MQKAQNYLDAHRNYDNFSSGNGKKDFRFKTNKRSDFKPKSESHSDEKEIKEIFNFWSTR